MNTLEVLKELCRADGISGREDAVAQVIAKWAKPFADGLSRDALGNLCIHKKGKGGEASPMAMVAAHMDEIGLVVTVLEKGFLRFTQVGGFDVRILPGQEVTVYGASTLRGIIASRPPHLLSEKEREKVTPLHELFIDVGLAPEEVERLVRAGDMALLFREPLELGKGEYLAAKALDDRAAVAAMLVALERLSAVEHQWNLHFVATAQEEVGLKGAMVSAFGLEPDIGLALDVGFGAMPGVSEEESLALGKGPAIAIGPNIHPLLQQRMVQVAKEEEIPYQVEPIPSHSGTDAWAIQVSREGIPTALLSIPLRSMHTTVETVSIADIERTGRLLAGFLAGLDADFARELGLRG